MRRHYKILNNTTKFKLIMDENLMLKIKQDHLKQILIIFIDFIKNSYYNTFNGKINLIIVFLPP